MMVESESAAPLRMTEDSVKPQTPVENLQAQVAGISQDSSIPKVSCASPMKKPIKDLKI